MSSSNQQQQCSCVKQVHFDPQHAVVLIAQNDNAQIQRKPSTMYMHVQSVMIQTRVAQFLGVSNDLVHVVVMRNDAWLVVAPNAFRLMALHTMQVDNVACALRAPHRIVIGCNTKLLVASDVDLWCTLLTSKDNSGIAVKPFAKIGACQRHAFVYFVDKWSATRAINACFRLTPPCKTPTATTIDNVRYTIACDWSPRPIPVNAAQTVPQLPVQPHPPQALPPPPPYRPNTTTSAAPAAVARTPPPPPTTKPSRIVLFHDAENCWMHPLTDGATLYRNVVQVVRQALAIDAHQAMSVDWHLVLRLTHVGAHQPCRAAIEDLRDWGVTMVDPGMKAGAVDTTIKDLMRSFLAQWDDFTSAAQQCTTVVLLSGDRDFARELRDFKAAGVRVVLLSGANVRAVLAQLVWKHLPVWCRLV